jgi:ATP-dependent DNA helicase DinG
MEPSDLGMPFPQWNRGQWEAISNLALDDAKYLILEAPTGVGKSAIAVGLSRLLDEQRTIILTSTIQLQDQYRASFPQLVKVMGRGNYPCLQEPSETAATALCAVGGQKNDGCPYYADRDAAQQAPEAILNYAYWLAQANYGHGFARPDLLICDEAHALEDHIRGFVSISVSRNAPYPLPPESERGSVDAWAYWAFRGRGNAQAQWREALRSDLGAYGTRRLHALYQAMTALMDADDDGWTVTRENWGYVFRPIWVSRVAPGMFLRHTQRVLFMSATILDKEMFCANLGIDPSQASLHRLDSTFPVASRPLFYAPVGRVKASDPASLDAVVRAVDDILDRHPGERGLIHTSSYKIAQAIGNGSRHAGRLAIPADSRSKDAALSRLRAEVGTVLVSPSVATGVDLPYDLCRFQIIAKLMFPDLGDPQIKKRMKEVAPGVTNQKGDQWYKWTTACSLVQAYGRGMRAEDDSCTTYLLDGNWQWFRHTVRDMLPGWFTKAIKTLPAFGDVDLERQLAEIRSKAQETRTLTPLTAN